MRLNEMVLESVRALLADDASTEIERKVRAFSYDLRNRLYGLRFANGVVKGENLRIELDLARGTAFRTPRQQAEFLSQGSSSVCWSAHMSDKARHIRVTYFGKYVNQPEVLFGKQFSEFARIWGETMLVHGLKNFRSGDGWGDGDGYHLQLPASMISKNHERAQACLEEYVRMTMIEKKPRNKKFENKYQNYLNYYLDKINKSSKNKPNLPKDAPYEQGFPQRNPS